MRTTPGDESHPLTGPTVFCACCLALLLASHIAIGVGLMRILRVEIPLAARSHMVRF